MMSFFRRMFGSKPDQAHRAIDEMSIQEVFAFLGATANGGATAKDIIASFRRLTVLALFTHGIPSGDIQAAGLRTQSKL